MADKGPPEPVGTFGSMGDGVRVEDVSIRPVKDPRVKAVATVRFDNGCVMRDVRVVNVGTEYMVGVPWKRADVRSCVKAGRLDRSTRKAIREDVLDEYILLLARQEG